jgi:hypothetical protein
MGKIERIQVSPEDRERLVRLVRDRNTAQIVLLAGERIGAVEVAARQNNGRNPDYVCHGTPR